MKRAFIIFFLFANWPAVSFAGSERHAAAPMTAERALATLMEGNRRYATNHMRHPHQTRAYRLTVSKEQHPLATILSCADSRVPPEIIFDEGLGDLFVVRVAGNILDDAILGSIEYSSVHLGAPLVVVLGHSRCGAVTAAVAGGEEHNHVDAVTRAIRPAADQAAKQPGDRIANAVRDNVRMVVEQLRTSHPVIAEMQATGRLRIVGAIYDLETGKVELLK